jgi:hypothetical protein
MIFTANLNPKLIVLVKKAKNSRKIIKGIRSDGDAAGIKAARKRNEKLRKAMNKMANNKLMAKAMVIIIWVVQNDGPNKLLIKIKRNKERNNGRKMIILFLM